MARPRKFDPQEALEKVTDVFWRKGFEGASMQEIEAATGLNKQSLYRLFPDKRAMYLAALQKYEEQEGEPLRAMLSGPGGASERFKRVFDNLVASAARGDRRGCFLCNAATDQAQLDPATQGFVSAAVKRFERMFREALRVSAPYNRDREATKAKAAALLSAYFGLRVLTRANAPLNTIEAAARQACETI
jgi:TetR/AcrR family transcriptional repressor of nem operon